MDRPHIGIGGRMQAGKTTCAEHLASRHGYLRCALADPIKDVARAEFGWDGRKDARGRRLLQELGTAGRNYDPDLWLRRFDQRCAAAGPRPVVVDDLRLRREVEHLRAGGFLTLRVVRPAGPEPGVDPALHAHETETELEAVPFDLVIVNDGTVADLLRKLEAALAPWLGGAAASAHARGPAD
jgi:hypothetical protein